MDFEKYGLDIKRLFNHLDEGVILVDGNNAIRWISEPGAEILGKNAARLLGSHIDEVFIEGSEVNLAGEQIIELKMPDGNEKHILITFKFVPLKSSLDGPWKAFVFKDISLMKDVEEEIKNRNKEISFITRNEKMEAILDLIRITAPTDASVLIQGESGTGKELIAKMIHQNSKRKGFPFITMNCAAFPETLIENELFGHIKGAFTGALTDKKGRFEIADGGTIFLDEIAEISPGLQAKLLRVLQDKSFEKLGSNKTITVDVRVVAATNKNIKEEIKKGRFREDVYYRLNVIPICLPPIRERREDIPALVMYYLKKFEQKSCKAVRGVTSEAMDIFMRYDWPGNAREIINVIEYALICAKGDYITVDPLPPDMKKLDMRSVSQTVLPNNETSGMEHGALGKKRRKSYKKVTLEDCLSAVSQCGRNKALAARMLDINRTTLYKKLKSGSEDVR
ncbi:MAG: ATPase [Nitrospira bacterium HGW-Nitrospira-1]|nr:MAG: ATPase [Nitrospira bacterium HGW-Nitrospira-1]